MHVRRLPVLMLSLVSVLSACSRDATMEPSTAMLPSAVNFPDVIALPDGFWPEGITFGRGSTFFVGSLATGAIYRGDARTGQGGLLVAEQPGAEKVGMEYDARYDRLFVAGGLSGMAFVYDASTGAELAAWQLGPAGASLINDVALTREAAYFTDSFNPVLYRVPLHGAALPGTSETETIPLTGDFHFVEDFVVGNANGIAATPDGSRLIIANTETGILYVVDPMTGVAAAIDLGGALVFGDGILLSGLTLYVVEGYLNAIAVVNLGADLSEGIVAGYLTDPALQFPSTIARFGGALYAVNARFDVAPDPTVEYSVVRLALSRRLTRLNRGPTHGNDPATK